MFRMPEQPWNTQTCSDTAKIGDLDVLKQLRRQDPPCPWDEKTCEMAANYGHIHILQWVRSQNPPCPWDSKTCVAAARNDRLLLLQWVRSQDPPCPWNEETCESAASRGHIHILQWMRSQNPPCPWNENTCIQAAAHDNINLLKWVRFQDPPCPWDEKTCKIAASRGNIHILKWVRSQNPPCPWDEKTCHQAVAHDNLNLLIWVRSQDPPCPWDEKTCQLAASRGNIHILQWVRSQNPPCPWDEKTCHHAVAHDNLNLLIWVRSQDPPCPWDEKTCQLAASRGHIHILQWVRSQNPPCPWDEKTCHHAAAHDNLNLLIWVRSQDPPCPWDETTCECSVNQFQNLQWLRSQNPPCPWDERTCNNAAARGHLDILKWVKSQNPPCPWDEHTCRNAANHGWINIIEWVRTQDPPCPWDENTCSAAAFGGYLDILKWVRNQDPPCPWDAETCKKAADKGHINILQWVRSQTPPCPWDKETNDFAAYNGHLHILQWARSQDPPCPWDEQTCKNAATGGRLDTLRWVRSQTSPCPWDRETNDAAAYNGHLHILKWTRSQDPPCPWDEQTCKNAAGGGRLDTLKWIRSQTPPCPWDRETNHSAAYFGHLHILKWTRSQEPPCPWNERTCKCTIEVGNLNIFKWLVSQQPPCPIDLQSILDTLYRYMTSGSHVHFKILKYILRSLNKIKISVSLKDFLQISGYHGANCTYDLSITIDKDNRLSFFHANGDGTSVTYVSRKLSTMTTIPIHYATSPILIGNGMGLYTNTNDKKTYMTSFDTSPAVQLHHNYHSTVTKNWSIFNNINDQFYIVTNLIPLKIFIYRKDVSICIEKTNVRHNYKNLESINNLLGLSFFQCGNYGVPFGDNGEHLFVGHLSVHKTSSYFPFLTKYRPPHTIRSDFMYFLYFYTISFNKTTSNWCLDRITSCFQPPGMEWQMRLKPTGITYDRVNANVLVTYVQNGNDCRLTCYDEDEMNTLLKPIDDWNISNYVIHPNYASSILDNFENYCQSRKSREDNHLKLIGISDMFSPDAFNSSITHIKDTSFMTVCRTISDIMLKVIHLNVSSDNEIIFGTVEGSMVNYPLNLSSNQFVYPQFIVNENLKSSNSISILLNEIDSDQNRNMIIANLNDGSISRISICDNLFTSVENNWSSFFYQKKLLMVCSLNPVIIIDTGLKDTIDVQDAINVPCTCISTTELPGNVTEIIKINKLKMYCGAPGLNIGQNEILFCGYSSILSHDEFDQDDSFFDHDSLYEANSHEATTVFFYTLAFENDSWVMKRLSCCSHLPGNNDLTKQIYPTGLTRARLLWDTTNISYIVTSCGPDEYCNYAIMTENFLKFILRPIEHWNVHNYVVNSSYFENIAYLNPTYKLASVDKYVYFAEICNADICREVETKICLNATSECPFGENLNYECTDQADHWHATSGNCFSKTDLRLMRFHSISLLPDASGPVPIDI
jgi:hypothetical protein